jgi:hypothetical protein
MAVLDGKDAPEKEPEAEAAIGKKHRYGDLNITHTFESDLADFVGTKVVMIRAMLKEGIVRDDTIKAFLVAFPKYKK